MFSKVITDKCIIDPNWLKVLELFFKHTDFGNWGSYINVFLYTFGAGFLFALIVGYLLVISLKNPSMQR